MEFVVKFNRTCKKQVKISFNLSEILFSWVNFLFPEYPWDIIFEIWKNFMFEIVDQN